MLSLASAFIYKSDSIKPMLEKLTRNNDSNNGAENIEDIKIKTQNEILDRTVAKLKGDDLHNNRTIVKSGGFGGGGDGSWCTVQKSRIGDSNYFVRAKITGKESIFDEESGQTITYIYADVDEYEKVTGTTIKMDNESGLIITDANLTESDYEAARAAIPDLNPEKLLIIAIEDPEMNAPDTNEFANVYLTQENNVFSTIC